MATVVLVFAVTGWFVAVGAPVPSAPSTPSAGQGKFSFRHDHVIGTSLDLWVVAADSSQAEAAERAVLDEIERLRLVFSTYDPQSELSRLNRTAGPFAASR